MIGIELAERGWLPDAVLRPGIRRLVARRCAEIERAGVEQDRERREAFLAECRAGPVALSPDRANAQHYEVPAAFFEHVLGPHRKYSCAHWAPGVERLAEAEAAMLALSCHRAGIEDGMRVLDLGCGWGSLSLWIAEHHPRCRVVAVSNSKGQREHILSRCAERGLDRVEVRTADVNAFEPEGRFDRVVSVEMFEHVRNHALLLERIARWLERDGRLFVHHFAHRTTSYPYEDRGEGDWMARHFFTGGMMPADDHLLRFQDDLAVERQWRVSGLHYRRTADAWLANLDAARAALAPVLAATYGAADADRWHHRWRLFFFACSELFGFRGGEEWFVSHLRLRPR